MSASANLEAAYGRERTISGVRGDTDSALDAERVFADHLLDAVGRVVEDLDHQVANLRSKGHEDHAQWIEDAMRPLRKIQSGVEPDV